MYRHPATIPIDELLADCDVRHDRRRGPGGQHRNKVETAVVLTHRPTGITAEASERRSQAENRKQAIARLRMKLAVSIRSPSESATAGAPSDLWRRRSADGRITVSTSHDDFPALVAEALDAAATAEFDLATAAATLGVTTTQLARLLQQEPTAWQLVNESRRTRGLRPLH